MTPTPQLSLLDRLSAPPAATPEPVPDRPDGVPGWIPVWESPAWPPAPWVAVEIPCLYVDDEPVQGWEARWPDGAWALIHPWEGGQWWWGASIGQSRDARHISGGPRDAIARAEAWLDETRGMIARGECL